MDSAMDKQRGRIRRKVMHRVTRSLNSDYATSHGVVKTAWNVDLRDRVAAAITEVLEEELG